VLVITSVNHADIRPIGHFNNSRWGVPFLSHTLNPLAIFVACFENRASSIEYLQALIISYLPYNTQTALIRQYQNKAGYASRNRLNTTNYQLSTIDSPKVCPLIQGKSRIYANLFFLDIFISCLYLSFSKFCSQNCRLVVREKKS